MKSRVIILLFHFKYVPKYIIKLFLKSQWKDHLFLENSCENIWESKSWLCPEPKEPPKPIAINLFFFFLEHIFLSKSIFRTPIYKAVKNRAASRLMKLILVLAKMAKLWALVGRSWELSPWKHQLWYKQESLPICFGVRCKSGPVSFSEPGRRQKKSQWAPMTHATFSWEGLYQFPSEVGFVG